MLPLLLPLLPLMPLPLLSLPAFVQITFRNSCCAPELTRGPQANRRATTFGQPLTLERPESGVRSVEASARAVCVRIGRAAVLPAIASAELTGTREIMRY